MHPSFADFCKLSNSIFKRKCLVTFKSLDFKIYYAKINALYLLNLLTTSDINITETKLNIFT